MKKIFDISEDNNIFQGTVARAFRNSKHPCFFLDEHLKVVWHNKVADRLFPQVRGFTDFLPYCRDCTEDMVEAELSLWHALRLPLSSDTPGGFSTLEIYEIDNPNQRLCRLFHSVPHLPQEDLMRLLESFERERYDTLKGMLQRIDYLEHESDGLPSDLISDMRKSTMNLLRTEKMRELNLRLKSEFLPHKFVRLNLPLFLSDALQCAQKLLRDAGIELSCHPPKAAAAVIAEPEYILHILGQLLSNAARFGTGQIEARYEICGPSIDIFVESAGAIPEVVRPKLFEPDVSYVPDGFGNGLGLYLSSQLAKFMGGELAFLEGEDKTIFKLTLPLYDENMPEMDVKEQFRLLLCDVPCLKPKQ